MKEKIKIGTPHFYYQMKNAHKVVMKNATSIIIIALVVVTLVLTVVKFFEVGTIGKLSMIATFFAITTLFLILDKIERSF